MRVMNAMLGRGRGGLEESFVVYHQALRAAGHEVISLLDPRAAVLEEVQQQRVCICPVRIWSHWDPVSLLRVRRALERFQPDVVVSHGNRAGRLLLRASGRRWPVLARLPNDRFRRILRCDGFIAILESQVKLLEQAGVPPERIFHVPSMLPALPPRKSRIAHHPPVIGAMGRFHPVKGFDVYLRALAWLRRQGVSFAAVLAGDGELRPALRKLSSELGLDDRVRFPGWVADRSAFFDSIDLFCVPSRQEAFARVMLEAMAHEVPLVVTDADGPREIVADGQTGLVTRREDPVALGQALERLLRDRDLAQTLAHRARRRVETTYTLPAVVPRLQQALETVVSLRNRSR